MNSSESPSFDREYQALRMGRAVVELTGWSSISVTGADRQAFLNNFCTNDVKRLVPGAGCEAFFTNVKGRIVAHGWIDCRESEVAFIGAPSQAPRLVEHLDRYVIREDVSLRDTTGERSYLLVAGDRQLDQPLRSISWNIIDRSDSALLELCATEASDMIGRLRDDGFVVASPLTFTATRIEADMPLYGIDFNEQNFPQEVGRDRQAISFTKGCYLGQETVARIDALGHVNQKIVRLRYFGNDVLQPGVELTLNGKYGGHVTSAAFSPKFGAQLALAMVRREANAPGTRLESPAGECEVVAA
jgi:tRNA-modifying protein YgfZ